jgi:hypothetical protein
MKVEWSKEDEERLRSLAMSGLSAAQIAAQIHRSKGSVRVRAAKLNIAIAREPHPMRKRKLVSARRFIRIAAAIKPCLVGADLALFALQFAKTQRSKLDAASAWRSE